MSNVARMKERHSRVTTGKGDVSAAKVRGDVFRLLMGQREGDNRGGISTSDVAKAEDLTQTVYDYLEQNYPEDDLTWVKDCTWRLATVPLDQINMARRPGGRDLDKVKSMAEAIEAGDYVPDPIVLVAGPEKMTVADGYHRTLAMSHADVDKAKAYVGLPQDGIGDWKTDVANMHAHKLNKSVIEAEIAKVGPKGYIHGWIFVGIPVPGQDVTHESLGHGKVTEVHPDTVKVKFDDGSEHTLHHVKSLDSTPADESRYLPGSPKYKAFNEGHAQATASAHIEGMSKEQALAKADEQSKLAARLPTAKGDTRKAQTEGMVAAYQDHAARAGEAPEPAPVPTPTPPAPAPRVPTPSSRTPFVYDDTKGYDENHTALTAHVRQSLKDQGIKASVKKTGAKSSDLSVSVITATAEQRFTEAEQAKITQTLKENGLTGIHGSTLEHSISTYGGAAYLPKRNPPERPAAPLARSSDIEDKAYADAMASNSNAATLSEQAYQAHLSARSARMTNGYGTPEQLEAEAREKGIRRAMDDKAKAEAASHPDLKPASGWRALTPEQANQEIRDRAAIAGTNARAAQLEADRISSTHESHLMADGSLVHFNNATKVSPAKKQVTLDAVRDLQKANPGQPPAEVFIGSGRATIAGRTPKRFTKGVRGYSVQGKPQVWVAPTTPKPSWDTAFKENVDAGHFMPAGKDQDGLRYVMAHEYGHTLDTSRTQQNPALAAALRPQGNPTFNADISAYGKKTSAETYAEAYAEWFMSGGKTANATVNAIAAAAGWSAP